jgi:hypothetical protein
VQTAGLADLVSGKIIEEGSLPDMVRAFPQDDPLSKSIYLKGRLGLSNFYYFDYKDIFQVQEGLAWMNDGFRKIIFKYADTAAAIDVVDKAKQSMANNKRFTDLADAFNGFSCKDNKGNKILAGQIENYLVILVGLDPDKPLEAFMDRVLMDIKGMTE